MQKLFSRMVPHVSCVFFVDCDNVKLVQAITVSFRAGGSKREVVKQCTIVHWRPDFSINSNCARHVQCGSVKKHWLAIIAEIMKIAINLVVE